MKDKRKQQDKKLQKPKPDYGMAFDYLLSGQSWSDYQTDLSNPQVSDDIQPPTEDDILAAWILGKDEEMNQYRCGGHLKQGYGDSRLNPNNKGLYYLQQQIGDYNNGYVDGNQNENPGYDYELKNNPSDRFGNIMQGFNTATTIASMSDKFADTATGAIMSKWGGTNTDPWSDAIYGKSGNGQLNRIFGSKDEFNNAMDQINNYGQNYAIGDNGSLYSQIQSTQYLQKSNSDAELGSKLANSFWHLPITPDPITNFIIGGAGDFGLAKLFGYDPVERQKQINNAVDIANNRMVANQNTAINNSQQFGLYNQLSQPYMAACGGKMKHRYDIGGYINSHFDNFNDDLIKIQSGGTHQENPNQGVQVSVAPDGQPNLVEEGETIKEFADGGYVFSDRIVAEQDILKNHLLNDKWAGKTYADISKELDKIVQEYKFDEASQKTFDEMTKRLQEAQEDQKFQEKQKEVEKFIDSLSDEQKEALEEEMVQEAQQEAEAEQAMQEQAAQEAQETQQVPVEQQPIQEEEMPLQAKEQPQMSPYDSVMSRAQITDAANQGLFQIGGFIDRLTLKDKYPTDGIEGIVSYEMWRENHPNEPYPRTFFDRLRAENKRQQKQFENTPYGTLVTNPVPNIVPKRKHPGDGRFSNKFIENQIEEDVSNQGLFGRGGHIAQEGLLFDEQGNILPEVEVTSTYIPQGEFFVVDDGYQQSLDRNAFMNNKFNLDYIGTSNGDPRFTRPANMRFTVVDGRYVPVSRQYQRSTEVTPPQGSSVFGNNYTRNFGRYGNIEVPSVDINNVGNNGIDYTSIFYNNPYSGLGNYLDNVPLTRLQQSEVQDAKPTGSSGNKAKQKNNITGSPITVGEWTSAGSYPSGTTFSGLNDNDKQSFWNYYKEKENPLVPNLSTSRGVEYASPKGSIFDYNLNFGNLDSYVKAGMNGDKIPGREMTKEEEKAARKAGWKKNKDGNWYNPQDNDNDGNPEKESDGLSTWLRYAPAIGSGLQALSDALGITNRNDYTNPNMFQRSINSIPNVGFVPIGGYRTPNYLDTLTASNINRSATEAARRAAINNSSGNASAALAALDAMNQQENNALGNLYIQAQQYNNQMEKEVALHNLRINQINASMSLSAQEKNQAIAAEKARLTYNLAQMRQQIENANDMAKSQNYTNLMTNLGNIGRENFIMNQVNSNMGLYYGVDRNGNAYYKSAYNNLSDDAKKLVDEDIKSRGLTIG